MLNVAILDDYQDISLEMADWGILSEKIEITVFNDHIHDQELLIERLRKFQVIFGRHFLAIIGIIKKTKDLVFNSQGLEIHL